MYQAVVFDLDGTLLDTLQDLAAAGNHALTMLGLPTHSEEAYRGMIGHGMRNLVKNMLPESCREDEDLRRQAFSLFTDRYNRHMTHCTRPYPGIPELLAVLKQRGIAMAVLSNKNDAYTKQIIDHFFSGIFDHVMGMTDKYPLKPQPDSLLALLQSMEVQPAQTLYCGDGDVDVLTAKNADLACCAVLWGFFSEERLRVSGAQYLAATPQELQEIILA